MRHYHKNKYIKKLNLFSKDAVKSLDTSGAKYDTFTWNNIRDLGLFGDCKMKIGSLDFDTFVSEQVATADIQAPVPPDDLVVHYKFDGDFLDSSGYDYHILENEGGVSIDTADYKKGTGSVDFDMTLTRGLWIDKISIKQSRISPHVYRNPNGMTISCWVKMRSRGNSDYGRLFEAKDANATPNTYGIAISSGLQGELRLYVNYTSLNYITFNLPSYNKWFHLTWVLIPNNTNWLAAEHTWKLYLDGVLFNTYNNQLYPDWTTDWDMVLGKWAAGVSVGDEREMDGNLDDFRIYDRILSSDEINRIMAEIQKDPIVHYKFDNNNIDNTGNTVANLASGSATYSTDRKRGTHSITTNSSVKYHLTKMGTPNVLTGLSAFSVCFWVKFENGTVSQTIVRQDYNLLIRTYTGNITQIYVNNDDNWNRRKDYNWNVTLAQNRDKWMFWCFTVDLPTNTIKFFIDNVEQTAIVTGDPIDFTVMPSTTNDFRLLNDSLNTYGLRGKLDDFRIYDKALDANEIREVMWADRGLYMWYKFEPVFNNFVASNDLLLHLEFENLTNVNDNVLIDSTGRNNIISLSGQTYSGLRSKDRRRGNYSFYGSSFHRECKYMSYDSAT